MKKLVYDTKCSGCAFSFVPADELEETKNETVVRYVMGIKYVNDTCTLKYSNTALHSLRSPDMYDTDFSDRASHHRL